ncbi:MAG: signal peptide peptidase SppA [Actinomycetota bacterium]|nr:signal peptide peptidase SppA [Actinomycetota bacterium]
MAHDDNGSPGGGMPERSPENTQNAPERKKRRKWPWVVGGIAAFIFLGLVVAGAVAVAILAGGGGGGGSSASNYTEEYVSGEGDEKVAVVPVEGTITADLGGTAGALPTTTPGGLTDALEQAADDDSVEAVILEINSPGGGVTASAEMRDAIIDFKEETDRPVVVSMADTAASGGYYIAAPADEIVAYESTLTGSLGVYIGLLNISEAAEEYGITQEYVRSGEFKTMGDPFRELSEDEREIFQSIVDQDYDEFVDVIVEGRDLPENEVRELADGRVYSGLQAQELGLVDEIGDLDRASNIASEMAEVEDPTVVRYVQEPGFGSLLMARLQPQPPEAVQVLEAAGVRFSGQPQYLYAPGVPGIRS